MISIPSRKPLYMALGRKPIISVEKRLKLIVKVENYYLLAISGLTSCWILGTQKQVAELNHRYRLRFDIAGTPRKPFLKIDNTDTSRAFDAEDAS